VISAVIALGCGAVIGAGVACFSIGLGWCIAELMIWATTAGRLR